MRRGGKEEDGEEEETPLWELRSEKGGKEEEGEEETSLGEL